MSYVWYEDRNIRGTKLLNWQTLKIWRFLILYFLSTSPPCLTHGSSLHSPLSLPSLLYFSSSHLSSVLISTFFCPCLLFHLLFLPISLHLPFSSDHFFSLLFSSPFISSSSRRRHDSEEGDSHRRHKHKKSKRSKEGKEASEEISADQENQEAME